MDCNSWPATPRGIFWFQKARHSRRAILLRLSEEIDHQFHILAQRGPNRAGAAILSVLLHSRAHFARRAARGNTLECFIRHKAHNFVDLLPGCGPAENTLYPFHRFRRGAASLGSVRLVREMCLLMFPSERVFKFRASSGGGKMRENHACGYDLS